MRRLIVCCALACAIAISGTARAQHREHDPVLVDRARAGALLDDVIEELARLEGKTEGKGRGKGKGDCRHLDQDLARARHKLKHLREMIGRAPSARELVSVGLVADDDGFILHAGPHAGPHGGPHAVVQPPAPPPMPAPTAPPAIVLMPARDFRALLGALKGESFGDGKLRVLAEAARRGWFSAEQVVALLGQFDFGNDKLKALEILAPRLADRENAFKIFQAFDFEGDKNKARAILSAGGR
ncbi:MAG: DUF4476 domain-containing protein [Deltaproteobacteria bacterium]|nr:DUF4476 domain-containing protein [Deltaproteobacteria bacterium]